MRRKPLPSQAPKSATEDAGAPAAVQAILNSSSYRQADHDVDFLSRADTRDIRLALDYEKAELLLRQRGIAHTIVVFGSTRICEPAAARREVENLSKQARIQGGDAKRRLDIAKRILAKSRYYEIARELGRIVSEAGAKRRRNRILIATGGGPGIMEAANRGACDAGAESVGLNITLPHEQFPNPYITPELCFRFHYFAMRKLHFLLRARALVAFPGGYGTMDEMFEVLTLSQTRKLNPLPVILVGASYWRKVFDPDFLVDEGTIDPEDRELFWFADSAEEIWRGIVDWYDAAGRPLLGPPEKDVLR
ncbi:MAG TPA: TIGR00730 family Rossman fold protein [Rhizomicrobium sp.]|nr:TIGR00730 family Rossman fold protein [Rhizomicrobium sp.]